MKKERVGETRILWRLDSRAGLGMEYDPLKPAEMFLAANAQDSEEAAREEGEMGIAWDCDCGFGVFGGEKAVKAAQEKILDAMMAEGRPAPLDDLEMEGVCSKVIRMETMPGDLAVLIGAGYLQEFEPDFMGMLEALPGVEVVYCGANYGESVADGSPLDVVHDGWEDFSPSRQAALEPFRAVAEEFRKETDARWA